MKNYLPDGRGRLFAYFAIVIFMGTLLLLLPLSWQGEVPLDAIDALFTATSAVTVTGLGTVATSNFTMFGQVVIIFLIQLGGLGILTVVVMAVLRHNSPLPLSDQKLLSDYFLSGVENRPALIVRKVLIYALSFEVLGTLLLIPAFPQGESTPAWFMAFFHSVSAFCNAGFSTYANSLENFAGRPLLTGTISFLIIAGGLGFVVHDDIRHFIARKTTRLRSHSKLVLVSTLILLVIPGILFAFMEWNHALAFLGDQAALKLWESFFMAVVPRTAGFDSIAPASYTEPSQVLTMLLMLIGGAPASTAGGLKVTTAAILVLAVLAGNDGDSDIVVGRRRLDQDLIGRAAFLVVRMAIVIIICFCGLIISEVFLAKQNFSTLSMAFETISAFCTVGLTLGITGELSPLGKLVIITTMYLGRIGIMALALPRPPRKSISQWKRPREEVFVG